MKMKISLNVLLAFSLAISSVNPCSAEVSAEQVLTQAILTDNTNPKWLTQAWDEKANRSYVGKAREVENLFKKKIATTAILKRYEGAARKQPNNSLTIFPWVYARFRLVESGRVQKPLSQVSEELYKVLVMAPSPPSSEYARLRFKIEARTHLRSRLQQIGARLVARYKDDQRVLLAYSAVLGDSGNTEAAVRNDHLLVKRFPKDPNHRWNLATDLTTLAWDKHDAKLLDAGEAQFKMFEKLAAPSNPLRDHLPNEREYIRRTRLSLAGKTP